VDLLTDTSVIFLPTWHSGKHIHDLDGGAGQAVQDAVGKNDEVKCTYCPCLPRP